MKTDIGDPWCGVDATPVVNSERSFEDSFVQSKDEHVKLADSEEYLEKLYSRLRNLQGGTSKKDLVSSLSVAKEECIARLIKSKQNFESEEEAELASNPVIRHIAPHLQALTASELVHLLKADVLQTVTETEFQEETVETSTEQEAKEKEN